MSNEPPILRNEFNGRGRPAKLPCCIGSKSTRSLTTKSFKQRTLKDVVCSMSPFISSLLHGPLLGTPQYAQLNHNNPKHRIHSRGFRPAVQNPAHARSVLNALEYSTVVGFAFCVFGFASKLAHPNNLASQKHTNTCSMEGVQLVGDVASTSTSRVLPHR